MKRSGSADLPLHYGSVPPWLASRMAKLGLAITESIITEYGKDAFLKRMSDPFWFQSFGAVMGMDWHSSGITTSVLGSLKKAINPLSGELGIYICGGKGKFSRQTPAELLAIGDKTGLDANELMSSSKLTAKVDNTAVQDGYQLYLHSFIVSSDGKWTVVQQGMNENQKTARRYHWHSADLQSFIEQPHTGICGVNHGTILNLTAIDARHTRNAMLQLSKENPLDIISTFQHLSMPAHHEVRKEDVNLKRLGSALWLAQEQRPQNFEELLLLQGVGPRTIQSLALVSEVIHGSPVRFKDPARFSFAHGGKDGHPFPVPVDIYDQTIATLEKAVEKSKLGNTDKSAALKNLHRIAVNAEKDFIPNDEFDALVEKERKDSWKYGGKTIYGDAKPSNQIHSARQLTLF